MMLGSVLTRRRTNGPVKRRSRSAASSSAGRGDLAGIPLYVKWFANGAATKKMYLTVDHTGAGEMRFSYHYQTAHLTEHDVELLYYYMMKVLFLGISESHITIGEILARA